jgi:hypothetical protein
MGGAEELLFGTFRRQSFCCLLVTVPRLTQLVRESSRRRCRQIGGWAISGSGAGGRCGETWDNSSITLWLYTSQRTTVAMRLRAPMLMDSLAMSSGGQASFSVGEGIPKAFSSS